MLGMRYTMAWLLPAAYRCVRPIERVTVWARKTEAAYAVVAELRRQGFAAEACTDLARAAAQAAIVGCATLAKSGDLLGPMSRGEFAAGAVQATLTALCRGDRPGRHGPAERTAIKSVGRALEGLAAAMLVLGLSAD